MNLLFIILSAAKAYYIMSEFMHLKYELKAMTLTVMTPFLFLIWELLHSSGREAIGSVCGSSGNRHATAEVLVLDGGDGDPP